MKIIQSDLINLLLLEYGKDDSFEAINLNTINYISQEKELVHIYLINGKCVTWTCDSAINAKNTYNNIVEFLTQSGKYSTDNNKSKTELISRSFDV